LRITTQLIETAQGTHLWADRFDGSLTDVFDLQDQIAETAAAVTEPRLRFAEVERLRRQPPGNLDAYEMWLRAVSLASEFTVESMADAMRCLERALQLEPSYALAMASFAYYHAHCRLQGWVERPDPKRARAVRLAYDSVEMAKEDANVLWQAAFAIWSLERDAPRALRLFRRALDINPNTAIGLAMAGWVEAANGDPKEGRRLLERSQQLSPRHPRAWFVATGMAIACLADHSYQEAISWAEKALSQNRRFAIALRVLAVALVNEGQIERAKKTVAEVLEVEPTLTISELRERLPHVPLLEVFADSLRQAGLPE
jgi:tetratricopeptide (TPR) repeat protein